MTERDFAIVHVVESGTLEHQSLLLCESIRRFTGRYRDCTIYAVSPRQGHTPDPATLREYGRLGVRHIEEDLNRAWSDYPYINTLYAAARIEDEVQGYARTLVLVDTDTLFLDVPTAAFELDSPWEIAMCPTHSLSAEIAIPVGHPITEFWQNVFRISNVEPSELWSVLTLLDRREIYAYFNNGLVSVRPGLRVFRDTLEVAERAARDGYFTSLPRGSLERFYLDQALLTATIVKVGAEHVRILGDKYNFPITSVSTNRGYAATGLVHVHYHDAFYFKSATKWFRTNPGVAEFLRSSLPIPLPRPILLSYWIRPRVPAWLRNALRRSELARLIFPLLRRFGIEI